MQPPSPRLEVFQKHSVFSPIKIFSLQRGPLTSNSGLVNSVHHSIISKVLNLDITTIVWPTVFTTISRSR